MVAENRGDVKKRGAFIWRNPNLFWTELTDCRASRGRTETERSGGQKGRGLGGRNFCPPSLSAAEFRISLCEMRRLFTIFDFWCSIEV